MIGLSLTASYALRILAYLARHPGEWIRGADLVARNTEVPRSYSATVLHRLGRAGLVHTRVGRRGGYRLAGDPERITVLDVVRAVDGDGMLERCLLGYGRCSGASPCALHRHWSGERKRIRECLEGMKLAVLTSAGTLVRGESHEFR